MKILFLAPQPFYQERGTPIAVNLAVRELCERGHTIDLLVYHEGEDVTFPGMALIRIAHPPFVHGIRPGFSAKKLVCDAYMFIKAWSRIRKNRPDVIHAVEESVFMAWFFKRLFGIPYVYDMDSSLPDQIAEKHPICRFILPLLKATMRPVIASAMMIAPVCESLAKTLDEVPAERVVILRDVSLLEDEKDRKS